MSLGKPEYKTLKQKIEHAREVLEEARQAKLFETEEEKEERLKKYEAAKIKLQVLVEVQQEAKVFELTHPSF